MKFSEIVQILKEKYVVNGIQIFEDTEITATQIFHHPSTLASNTVLYILDETSMETETGLYIANSNFVFISTKQWGKIYSKHNIIQLSPSISVDNLYQYIQQLLEEEALHNAVLAELYQYTLPEKNMDSLMDKVHEYFGNPIMFYDYSNTVEIYRHTGNLQNKVWQDSIERGTYDFSSVDESFYRGFRKVTQSRDPLFSQAEQHQYATCSVLYGNDLVGFFSVLEYNKKLSNIDLKVLRVVADIIAIRKSKDRQIYEENEFIYSQIIVDLLENKITTRHELNNRMLTRNMKESPAYRIFLLRFKKQNPHYIIQQIKKQLGDLFPDRKTVIYAYDIILLEEDTKHTIPIEQNLMTFFLDCELDVGVSDWFDNFLDLPLYYCQAKSALEFKDILQMEQPTFFYDCIKLLDLERKICKMIPDIESFLHPVIHILEEYDSRNDSNLLDTLYYYLSYNGSIYKTAIKMHYHKNTILYRIKKIKELTGIDLKDSQTSFHLMLSYRLHQAYMLSNQKIHNTQ